MPLAGGEDVNCQVKQRRIKHYLKVKLEITEF